MKQQPVEHFHDLGTLTTIWQKRLRTAGKFQRYNGWLLLVVSHFEECVKSIPTIVLAENKTLLLSRQASPLDDGNDGNSIQSGSHIETVCV